MGNSDYLFSMPSFTNGIARTIDIFGNLTEYNSSDSPEEADRKAFFKDGLAICEDMGIAFRQFEQQLNP
ncbi:MAG: hypothetical protein B0D92_05570 [Spirochaeta sp. LUC14_002_19_P3]|nr:MAG: hypothetical protein B0D92_05570 [Spirochaeta sp. LUC14_002_19_P3]